MCGLRGAVANTPVWLTGESVEFNSCRRLLFLFVWQTILPFPQLTTCSSNEGHHLLHHLFQKKNQSRQRIPIVKLLIDGDDEQDEHVSDQADHCDRDEDQRQHRVRFGNARWTRTRLFGDHRVEWNKISLISSIVFEPWNCFHKIR